jgi:hypothetical protein
MQIYPSKLLAILSYEKLKRTKLNIGAAVAMTRRHYCSQMTMNNLCPGKCEDCSVRILAAIDHVLKADVKPEAAFVVKLRDQAANAMDEQDTEKVPTVALNKFGEKDNSVDLFGELEATLK